MSLDKKVDDKFKDFLYREEEDETFRNSLRLFAKFILPPAGALL